MCPSGCKECSTLSWCLQCSSPSLYLSRKQADEQVCEKNCDKREYFGTLDRKCIRCDLYVPGCKTCTRDASCWPYTMPFPKGKWNGSCEYSTECTICNHESGFIKDKIGRCCKVNNCNVCHETDQGKCMTCNGGFFLLEGQYTSTGMDECITENHCRDVLKKPEFGFFPEAIKRPV